MCVSMDAVESGVIKVKYIDVTLTWIRRDTLLVEENLSWRLLAGI
jgi:hypothetical protein